MVKNIKWSKQAVHERIGCCIFQGRVDSTFESTYNYNMRNKKILVLGMDTYNRFQEYELEAALNETRKDLTEGHFVEESVEDHMHRITNEV